MNREHNLTPKRTVRNVRVHTVTIRRFLPIWVPLCTSKHKYTNNIVLLKGILKGYSLDKHFCTINLRETIGVSVLSGGGDSSVVPPVSSVVP